MFPFQIVQLEAPNAEVQGLFHRSFGSEPPAEGHHFIAKHTGQGYPHLGIGYVHFRQPGFGVFLCGGLCIDSRIYRYLKPEVRSEIASLGSLSRWLSNGAISALRHKRAIFAYTGNARSRRDAFALNFSVAIEPYLLVQWHIEGEHERAEIVKRVAALGAF